MTRKMIGRYVWIAPHELTARTDLYCRRFASAPPHENKWRAADNCPFCGYEFTVPNGETWYCYHCQSGYDQEGNPTYEPDPRE